MESAINVLMSPEMLIRASQIFWRLMLVLIVFLIGRAFVGIVINHAIQTVAVALTSLIISLLVNTSEDPSLREAVDRALGTNFAWVAWLGYFVW